MLLGFIIAYLVLTILIGFWASRKVKTTQDFVIAGRGLPMALAATALFATWFGSETIMGASSEFVEGGLLAVIKDPYGAALCLFLVGRFFARPLYRLNILTFNDFFKQRFSRRTELISAIFMVPSYFGWIAAQLVAMAVILHTLTGISLPMGVSVCATIVVLYTYVGGMWAVSITDFIQSIMILVGMLVLAGSMYQQVGGFQPLIDSQPDGFFRFVPHWEGSSIALYISAWITVGLGSIPQQDVFQRVMAARSAPTAVNASYLAAFMYATIGSIPLFIGLCGHYLYPEIQGGEAQMTIPLIVLQHSSMALQILFFGALLSAILSTTSGAMLAPATVIGENIVKYYFKNLTDKGLLRIMRFSIVAVAVCSAAMALRESNIYHLAEVSSSLSLVSLFIPLTAGLYWKQASERGAVLSILAGMVTWGIFSWMEIDFPANIPGTLASLASMIIGSLAWPDTSKATFDAWQEGRE
ncbi:MAG: sodium:solute symporter family protein [Saprospiraceae bacterium]